jgi:hypothetical protein
VHKEEKREHQVEQAPRDPPEEVPVAEEVMEGDKEADESDGDRQKERVPVEEAMEQDEVAEGKYGGGHSTSSEDVASVTGGQEPEAPPVASVGGGPNGTQENRPDMTPDVAIGDSDRTAVSNASAKSEGTRKMTQGNK